MAEDRENLDEHARREFLSKAAAAVGRKVDMRRSPLRRHELQDGRSFEPESADLTNILAREGLFTEDLMGRQALMRVEIRYSL